MELGTEIFLLPAVGLTVSEQVCRQGVDDNEIVLL